MAKDYFLQRLSAILKISFHALFFFTIMAIFSPSISLGARVNPVESNTCTSIINDQNYWQIHVDNCDPGFTATLVNQGRSCTCISPPTPTSFTPIPTYTPTPTPIPPTNTPACDIKYSYVNAKCITCNTAVAPLRNNCTGQLDWENSDPYDADCGESSVCTVTTPISTPTPTPDGSGAQRSPTPIRTRPPTQPSAIGQPGQPPAEQEPTPTDDQTEEGPTPTKPPFQPPGEQPPSPIVGSPIDNDLCSQQGCTLEREYGQCGGDQHSDCDGSPDGNVDGNTELVVREYTCEDGTTRYLTQSKGKTPGVCSNPASGTQPPGGNAGDNPVCTIGHQTPNAGDTCASCINTIFPGTPKADAIKSMNPSMFNACSATQLINYWCNGGISEPAKEDCKSIKTKQDLCAAKCADTGAQPTATIAPGAPTPTSLPPIENLDSSTFEATCQGTTLTFRWRPVIGARKYAIRIDDKSNVWTGNNPPSPGDTIDDNVAGPNYTKANAASGRSYEWWVHSVDNANRWSSAVSGPAVTCGSSAPTATPTITPTGAGTPTTVPPTATPTPTPNGPTPTPIIINEANIDRYDMEKERGRRCLNIDDLNEIIKVMAQIAQGQQINQQVSPANLNGDNSVDILDIRAMIGIMTNTNNTRWLCTQ